MQAIGAFSTLDSKKKYKMKPSYNNLTAKDSPKIDSKNKNDTGIQKKGKKRNSSQDVFRKTGEIRQHNLGSSAKQRNVSSTPKSKFRIMKKSDSTEIKLGYKPNTQTAHYEIMKTKNISTYKLTSPKSQAVLGKDLKRHQPTQICIDLRSERKHMVNKTNNY